MKSKKNYNKRMSIPRRSFVKTVSAVSASVLFSGSDKVYANGSNILRVGLIGCGSRGTGAFLDCVESSPGIQLTAIGDLLPDRLEHFFKKIGKKLAKRNLSDDCLKISEDAKFSGFDAYQKVLATDVDLVILATPPHFRPLQLKAAIEANKHVFMEKPAAVDPVGVRSVIKTAALADEKKLCVVAGTQRRHQPHYLETMKRIHNGDIGEILDAQCYWNQEDLLVAQARRYMAKRYKYGWSDMEWQIRSWLFFTWLSGDHITEQHVHNLDVINWAMGSHPVKCMGMGGRQIRTEPQFGNIFDHFSVEYEYPNGARVLSMCRQTKGCSTHIAEHIRGTKGTVYTDGTVARITGPYSFEVPESVNPYVQEHADLVRCIRQGIHINEAKRIAESTMTAIIGRMSAYTGHELKWDWAMNKSQLDLAPEKYELGSLPVTPVAIPGETKLI